MEKTDVSVSRGGKLRWLEDGEHHERDLTPRQMASIVEIFRETGFGEMDGSYGKAMAEGGFRRMTVRVDGADHEVIVFANADREAPSKKKKEKLKDFKEAWDFLIALPAGESVMR